MSLLSKSSGYRPDVDGLRAIAILSVLFYHAGLGCSGGYVGVDVFFVISGYLITSLILKDLQADKFSLVNFWERRLRRIFPALAAMVGVTLIAGWFLLLPEHLEKLGQSTIAQALLSANFYFWRTTSYFGGANAEKPLLHTWSLAVEEQFYLFFPLILIFLFRSVKFRRPRNLMTVLLAGFAVSLLASVWGVKHQPYATFFLLPTRAWELTCGALVAVLPATTIPASRLLREGASWLGLAAIFVPVCIYRDNTPFPGLAALPPCLGTALLIWANSSAACADGITVQRTLPAMMLSLRGVTFIGIISYSLYLWHWPVLAFSNYWKTAPFTPVMRWSLVGVSFVLAVISWRYIETPFRRREVCGTRRKIFTLTVASTTLVCVSGFCFTFFHGIPDRLPKEARAILEASDALKARRQLNLPTANPTDITELKNDSLPRFGSANPSAPIQFLVWGDSHAKVAIPAFDALAKEVKVSGCAAIWYSTPPLVGEDYHIKNEAGDAAEIGQTVVTYVKRNKIPYTLLVAYWGLYQEAVGERRLEASLKHTIEALQSTGTKVCVVLDVPAHETDVTRAMMRGYILHMRNWDAAGCSETDYRANNSALFRLESTESSVVFLDPTPLLLDASHQSYRMTWNGVPLYYDKSHLSEFGALTVMLPMLETNFAPMLKTTRLINSAQAHRQTP